MVHTYILIIPASTKIDDIPLPSFVSVEKGPYFLSFQIKYKHAHLNNLIFMNFPLKWQA